ncbi:MAG: FtsW/RodA/SpoVE family cell cycle protein, partial [Bacteroidales bacterium]|nr:FtsW/RodA/SpoVE family cell cycle protein [Bacteroidales bacterium]
VIWVIYRYCTLKGLMKFGVFGFLLSLALLLFLTLHIKIPHVLESQMLNGTWRTLSLGGHVQIHVFEIVKVFSVMYMAWAVTSWREEMKVYEENTTEEDLLADKRGFWRLRRTAWHMRWEWMDTPFFKRALIIYLPFIVVCGMVSPGSNSSMIIIAGAMIVTLLIGGFSFKKLAGFLACCAVLVAVVLGTIALVKKDKDKGGRLDTASSRIEAFFNSYENQLEKARALMAANKMSRTEFNDFIDEHRQVQGARFAIREGRVTPLGKFPGGSTQKYKVMGLFGDFMFSFICEEYGIFGALFVIFLFGALIARGTRIANYCSDVCARTMVAGLVILISGQALIHILVNTGIIPMTGQTLPILSDGKSAMLMFSIALGVVLGVSRIVREEIEKEEAGIEPVITHEGNDEIQHSMDDLDALESNGLSE